MLVQVSISEAGSQKVEVHWSFVIQVLWIHFIERLKSERRLTEFKNFGSLRCIDAKRCMIFRRAAYFGFKIVHLNEPTTSWRLLPFVVELNVSVVGEFNVDSVYYWVNLLLLASKEKPYGGSLVSFPLSRKHISSGTPSLILTMKLWRSFIGMSSVSSFPM